MMEWLLLSLFLMIWTVGLRIWLKSFVKIRKRYIITGMVIGWLIVYFQAGFNISKGD